MPVHTGHSRTGPGSAGRCVPAMVCAVMLVAGCGSPTPPASSAPAAPASATLAASPSPSPSGIASGPAVSIGPTVEDLADVCAPTPQRAIFAKAYTGAGPHPVMLFRGALRVQWQPRGLPAGWDSAAAAVQLVACVEEGAPAAPVRTCAYGRGIFPDGRSSTPAPLLSRTYTLRLFEAVTGRQLTTYGPVLGEDTTCPAAVTPEYGRIPDQYTQLSAGQLAAALRRFIE